MAKGKQAALAANRRLEAARDHIDRLTSDLADARIRARDAEKRASKLEGVEQLISKASWKNDEMLADCIRKLQENRQWFEGNRRRQAAALRDLGTKFFADIGFSGSNTTLADKVQFVATRYPGLWALLRGGDVTDVPAAPVVIKGEGLVRTQRRLQGEDLRRFQRMVGIRGVAGWDSDRDVADIWCDMLDAKQTGMTADEMREVLDIPQELADELAHQLHTEQPPGEASNGAQRPETAS